ncbi:zinc finger protein basonuclin-2-like, partial [Thrips palmi]|uniref:Zinc finger protein basonuclin-2-like n=1 Tax=Thrips palmi TaxID=161013 RepID=A0A6P9AKY4_THRPL
MESYKTMETMEEALDKLGCRQNFGQGPVEPVEPVQPHALLDIASLALYGCHALPVRLKILLDRLFSVLRPDQVVQVLRGFGWTQDDYARGYILNEANGASLDRFNICSPEEEPLVLQQFLRFGETRALTEQLLRGAAAPGAAGAASAGPSPASSASSQSSKPGQEASHAHERLQPAREEPVKTTPVHSPHQRDGPAATTAPAPSRHTPPPTSPGHRDNRDDDKRMPHALNFSLGSSASSRQGPPSTGVAPVSPQQKHAPSGPSSVGRQSPPSGQPTPHSALSFLNRGAQPQPQSPPGSSPLNRLQNMQPFDFRKMAASAVRSSPEPPAGPGGVPGLLNLRPPPPPTVPTSTMSSLPLPFGHSSLTAANLVASSFPGLISSAMAGHPGHPSLPPHPGSKSPSTDLTSRAGSSDFGSGSDDDDDNSALNLSRDRDARDDKMRAKRSGSPPQQRSSKHPSSSFSPLKRQSAWPSSHLPANLGTQLINPTTGKKRVQCNVCLKTFCDKGALKIHFSAVHLREMHRCTVEGCSMMFSSRRSRNRHSANPNPKLHSPHLRRKISPHDGRSAQSHPILLPPHQAGLGVGLNPLSFGAFPLLPQDPRDPRDPRNAAMAAAAAAAGGPSALDLNLKNSLGLTLRYEREARERHREMTSMSMDEDDDDDEEGIVVVGGADDDDDEPQDLHQSKRLKFSVSDDGDDHSNTDDDSQSALDLGTSAASASNGVDHHGLGHHFAAHEPSEQARGGRKRKSQNPTRCTQPVAAEDLSNYDDSSSDAGSHMYPGMDQGAPQEAGLDLAVRRKSPDHMDTEERLAREQDSVQPPHEEGSSQDDQVFRLTKEKKGDSIEPPTENRVREMKSAAGGVEEEVKDEVEEEKDSVIKAEADPNGVPSSPCAGSPPCSPAASPASSLELGDGSHDEDGYFYPDGYFANIDVPMDKDNPRKCTACGKVFQNHFGVKTHYQNVHLKLMHKCSVDGCNAAFPSKRSRDRHSANLNLHRKLLSTSSSPTHGDKPGHPMFLPHPDVLARLYADPSLQGMQGGRPLDHQPLLMGPFGYPAMGAMGFHPLNGRAGSASPTSPRSLDEELMGRPAKLHDAHDPFLGARSRSDPGGLAALAAMEPGLPLG